MEIFHFIFNFMDCQNKNHYQTYKFRSRNEVYSKLCEMPTNRDRAYMINMIKLTFEYLEKVNIIEYQDMMRIFKDYGFRTVQIQDFIWNFKEFINSQKNDGHNNKYIDWLRKRELYKANKGERNLFLIRLSHEYPNEMLFFAQEYYLKIFPNSQNVSIFMKEMHEIIKNIVHGPKNIIINTAIDQ